MDTNVAEQIEHARANAFEGDTVCAIYEVRLDRADTVWVWVYEDERGFFAARCLMATGSEYRGLIRRESCVVLEMVNDALHYVDADITTMTRHEVTT